MGSLRAAIIVAATAAIAAGVDLLTKAIAADRLSDGSVHALLPGLDLKLAFNHGISFSLLPAYEPATLAFLLAFQGALTGLVSWLAFRADGLAERLGLALVTGGALGNLLDRWRHGGVTDWIDLHPAGSHWFTFNLADAWISVGVVLLVRDAIMTSRDDVRGRA
ncbi:MAG: signal peptidase II [Methylobacteriaceae bacterium]